MRTLSGFWWEYWEDSDENAERVLRESLNIKFIFFKNANNSLRQFWYEFLEEADEIP